MRAMRSMLRGFSGILIARCRSRSQDQSYLSQLGDGGPSKGSRTPSKPQHRARRPLAPSSAHEHSKRLLSRGMQEKEGRPEAYPDARARMRPDAKNALFRSVRGCSRCAFTTSGTPARPCSSPRACTPRSFRRPTGPWRLSAGATTIWGAVGLGRRVTPGARVRRRRGPTNAPLRGGRRSLKPRAHPSRPLGGSPDRTDP